MESRSVSVFSEVLSAVESPEYAMLVVNRRGPEPYQRLLEQAFDRTTVALDERYIPKDIEDAVFLFEDGHHVATSSMDDLSNGFLLVNADLYRTGTSGIDQYEAPDVLVDLDEEVFTLRGFSESNKEKLLLIVIARFIESIALEAGAGRLDAAFQRLSRIDDELGTRRVYERLAESDVETQVYGVPDWDPETAMDVTANVGRDQAYRRSWFVVYHPDGADVEHDPAALVAVETGDNEWTATWTFDEEVVEMTRERIDRRF